MTVQANVPYTTEIAADWITAITSRSLTEEILTFQVAANEDTENREGTITFISEDGSLTRTVTVKQAGKQPSEADGQIEDFDENEEEW